MECSINEAAWPYFFLLHTAKGNARAEVEELNRQGYDLDQKRLQEHYTNHRISCNVCMSKEGVCEDSLDIRGTLDDDPVLQILHKSGASNDFVLARKAWDAAHIFLSRDKANELKTYLSDLLNDSVEPTPSHEILQHVGVCIPCLGYVSALQKFKKIINPFLKE
jgi:hypothetical protein